MEKKEKVIIPLALGVFSLLYFSFFINRSLSIYDEGYVLEASRLFYEGSLPFRDFFYQYPPLTVWLGGFWFEIFGLGITTLRWLALFISTASVILGYLIVKRVKKSIITLLTSFSLIAWGFPHTNFLWPTSVSIFLLFLIIYLLIKFEETKNVQYLFFAGVSITLSMLNKQNIGMANLIGGAGYVLFLKAKVKDVNLGSFFLGIISSALISFLFIYPNFNTFRGLSELLQRSIGVVRADSFIFPYTLISKLEPGFYGLAKWAGKSFVYLYPLFLIALSAILALRGRIKSNLWNLIFFLTGLHFLVVVWPLSDLAHLSFAIPAIILMISGLNLLNKPFLKKISYLSLIIFTLIGFYKTFFMRYYTFETPYLLQTNKVVIEGKNFYLDKKHAVIVEDLARLKNSRFEGKRVFVHPYVPMFYYLLDRNPPTYDLYTVSSLLSEKAMQRTINEIEEKDVDFVILEPWREKHLSNPISDHIRENYSQVDRFWDYEVYERK